MLSARRHRPRGGEGTCEATRSLNPLTRFSLPRCLRGVDVTDEIERTAPRVPRAGCEPGFESWWDAPEDRMSADATTIVLPARSPGLRLRVPGGRGALGLGAAAALGLGGGVAARSLLADRRSSRQAYVRQGARAQHRAREVRVSPHPGRLRHHRDRTLRVSIRRRSDRVVRDRVRALTSPVASGPVSVRPGVYSAPPVDVAAGPAVSVAPRPARARRPCVPGTLGCLSVELDPSWR
jgi:hypothetical protein